MSDSFADFLKKRLAEAQEAAASQSASPDPASVLAALRAAAQRHAEADDGPRFPVGAFVTPVADSTYIGAAQPHVVVAVRAAQHDFANGQIGANNYGVRYDTRVIQ
jgi:hypothetical protein